ncbi:MAG TPA: hypothetical protein VI933_04180 [archaeon]|nr:hypothetical protein [archaeon]
MVELSLAKDLHESLLGRNGRPPIAKPTTPPVYVQDADPSLQQTQLPPSGASAKPREARERYFD